MKKLIFCLVVLLVSAGFTNAQLNGTYTGTATDINMGQSVPGTYSCTTTFSNDTLTAITMGVAGHFIEIGPNYPRFSSNGTSYGWHGNGTGTVITPDNTYFFYVTNIDLRFNGYGKLTYFLKAYVPTLNMGTYIYYTFTAN